MPDELPLGETLRRALIAFNAVPTGGIEQHRRRMDLLLTVPALQAHSMLMYNDWRQVIAEHCASRLGVDAASHLPQNIAWMTLGVSLAAYDQWLADPSADLEDLLDAGSSLLTKAVAGLA